MFTINRRPQLNAIPRRILVLKEMVAAACSVRSISYVGVLLLVCNVSAAHEDTLPAFLQAQETTQTHAIDKKVHSHGGPSSRLTINLVDAGTNAPIAGLVRITEINSGQFVAMPDLVKRELGWHAMPTNTSIDVPRTQLKVEAAHGLETELFELILDSIGTDELTIALPLRKFYDTQARGLKSGNTHLHLRNLSLLEADNYLRIVPAADNLDLIYLSYLRRIPDEISYISNEIVTSRLNEDKPTDLFINDALVAIGQEHRHNFGIHGEGYGHVMFLNILQLIQPVSIGPGLMQKGTDGVPLQEGIVQARDGGATVIWAHNMSGFEDIPNWLAGTLDAQNIFDGAWSNDRYIGTSGTYDDTFYRYLNLGMRVPFSTGTDWFIYDFSRVYVPIEGELTSQRWLTALSAGKSYITNGTFLELEVAGRTIGDTVSMLQPGAVDITAHAIGREDFGRIELLYNGDVINAETTKAKGSHFEADLTFTLNVSRSGWIALRIAPDARKNLFGKPLFAHTSPVYIELAGNRLFERHIAEELISEIKQDIEAIQVNALFADEEERTRVLAVYQAGIVTLQEQLRINREQ